MVRVFEIGSYFYLRAEFLPIEWALGLELCWDGKEGEAYLRGSLGPIRLEVGITWAEEEGERVIGFQTTIEIEEEEGEEDRRRTADTPPPPSGRGATHLRCLHGPAPHELFNLPPHMRSR